jgi:hypothetical protein
MRRCPSTSAERVEDEGKPFGPGNVVAECPIGIADRLGPRYVAIRMPNMKRTPRCSC